MPKQQIYDSHDYRITYLDNTKYIDIKGVTLMTRNYILMHRNHFYNKNNFIYVYIYTHIERHIYIYIYIYIYI